MFYAILYGVAKIMKRTFTIFRQRRLEKALLSQVLHVVLGLMYFCTDQRDFKRVDKLKETCDKNR